VGLKAFLKFSIKVVGYSVGIASAIWFAFAFYMMTFYHRGVLYVEPNRFISTTELVVSIAGIIALFIDFLAWAASR
jgi:multidrug transporter EmrE-like cation transporter